MHPRVFFKTEIDVWNAAHRLSLKNSYDSSTLVDQENNIMLTEVNAVA